MELTSFAGAQVAQCETFHARKDGPRNQFRYKLGYLILPMLEPHGEDVRLFSRNQRNLVAFLDRDHGTGQDNATAWVLEQASRFGIAKAAVSQIWLLTQPRLFGYVFNPVSFWFLVARSGGLLAVLSEVNNTFGERHSYLCMHDNLQLITAGETLTSQKVFHVSPFQDVIGTYAFRFNFQKDRFAIWINYQRPDDGGLFTSLIGTCAPMTDRALLAMTARKPFGSLRVMSLIHWQALKLTAKRAGFRSLPKMPDEDVTR